MAVDAPPAPPTATAAPASAAPPAAPVKTNLETAFDQFDSKAKPPSLEQPPIPDHPGQKDIREREARDKAEAEAAAKKAKEQRTDEDDEDDDEHEEAPAAETEEQKAARLKAEKSDKAKQEEEFKKAKEKELQPPPGKKKGEFLREELAKVKSERDNFKSEIDKLKTAPKGDDPEKKALQDKIAAMEKRQQQIEDDYRLHSYEKSSEYNDKFLKPYQQAYHRGRQKAVAFEVTTAEGALRPATPEDFDSVMLIQNDSQASRMAKELFGDNAAIIMHHRERILEANEARVTAIEEAKTSGVKKVKELEETSQKQREAIWNRFNSTIKDREEKLEFLKPLEGDAAWNEALERGKKMADRSYHTRDGKTPEEQAEIDAANYVRARAYSPLRLSVKRLRSENAELKKQIEKFKGSEPGPGEGKVAQEGQEPPPANTMDAVFQALDKRAKPVQFY